MKRGIITNNGAVIRISDGEVWMTAWEIADLFYTTAGVINSRIKAILKTNVLKEYEVCQCINLENGNSADMYNLNMIIALVLSKLKCTSCQMCTYLVRFVREPVITEKP